MDIAEKPIRNGVVIQYHGGSIHRSRGLVEKVMKNPLVFIGVVIAFGLSQVGTSQVTIEDFQRILKATASDGAASD